LLPTLVLRCEAPIRGTTPCIATRDLVLTDIEPSDVQAVLAIRHSNPDRLSRTEGNAGDSGVYDLDMLERDLAVALADPTRHTLVARLRSDDRVVALVDTMDAHPPDGLPWLGVVEVHASEQRRGIGRQCTEAIGHRARTELAARSIRAAADADDTRAEMFFASTQFVPIDTRERSSPQGRVRVIVYERALMPD
jgi:hypothetical protein